MRRTAEGKHSVICMRGMRKDGINAFAPPPGYRQQCEAHLAIYSSMFNGALEYIYTFQMIHLYLLIETSIPFDRNIYTFHLKHLYLFGVLIM